MVAASERRGQVFDLGERFFGSDRYTTGDQNIKDPASTIDGMPPSFGQYPVPHVFTFQGIFGSVSNVYRPSDEAIRHSYDNARFMTNDPSVMECVEQRIRSTCLLDWHLEVDDEKDSRQKELAENLTSLIKAMPRFMQYRENLMRAIWYGRSANTHRWRWKYLHGKKRLVIDRWLPVHGDKLVFRYDKDNGEYNPDQVGIRVGGAYQPGARIANRWKVESVANKVQVTDTGLAYFLEECERPLLAIHKHMIEDGEYEAPEYAGRVNGVGIRSRIYWVWYQKQEMLSFLMEFLERSAFGIELWYYPQGNKKAKDETMKAATERIGDGRNVILVPQPEGGESGAYRVDRIEPSMGGADVLKEIITSFGNHQIKRYVLGQTLTTESQATGLGSNLASIHLDTYMQIVRYDATNIDETLTTDLVEVLRDYNYPRLRDIPVRFKTVVDGDDVEQKLAAYKSAFDMGLSMKASQIANMIGAERPDDGDEVLQNVAYRPQAPAEGGQGTSTSVAATDGSTQAAAVMDAIRREQEQSKRDAETDSDRETYASGDRELSSTQFNLPRNLANRVMEMGRRISDADLAEYGREDEPHVTIKYGLHTSNPSDVSSVASGFGPVEIKLGRTSFFECNKYDVVKIDVESKSLRSLNAKIGDKLECTDTHPDYIPHVTIAYVKKGLGKKYAGMNDMEGVHFTGSELIFSRADGERNAIRLDGTIKNVDDDQSPEPDKIIEQEPCPKTDYATSQRRPGDRLKGGLADAKNEKDFDARELQRGAQHELAEHGGDWRLAKEIAMDHLTEDPDYYRKLRRRMIDMPNSATKQRYSKPRVVDREAVDLARTIVGNRLLPTAMDFHEFDRQWEWEIESDNHPIEYAAAQNRRSSNGETLMVCYSRLSQLREQLAACGADGLAEIDSDIALLDAEIQGRVENANR